MTRERLKDVLIQVEPEAVDGGAEILSLLSAAGLHNGTYLARLGIITGRIRASRMKDALAVHGVISMRADGRIDPPS
ncbi:MAG: hypothetical protein ACPGGK_08325 [Pikeienuella sp.]